MEESSTKVPRRRIDARALAPLFSALAIVVAACDPATLKQLAKDASASGLPSSLPSATASPGATPTPTGTPTQGPSPGHDPSGAILDDATPTPAPTTGSSPSPSPTSSAAPPTPTPSPTATQSGLMSAGVTLDKTAVTLGVPPKDSGATPLHPTTVQLAADVLLSNGTHESSVTWSSSDATVASVSTLGLVTAVKGGTAKIKATSIREPLPFSSNEAVCDVTVRADGDIDFVVD